MSAYYYNPLVVVLPGGPTLPPTGTPGDRFYLSVGDVGVYVCGGNNVWAKLLDTASVEIGDTSALWGGITGTLSDQTDLQTVLNTKGTSSFSGVYADLTSKPTLFSGVYSDLTSKPILGTAAATASTDYATSAQGTKADSAVQPARTVNGHALSADVTVSKSDVGLGNVDNTSDVGKPVSTAQQTALDLKANLAGPTFTGTVTLPSATVTLAMQANMATSSVVYRKTAGSGVPEVNTLATLKTDLVLVKGDVGLGNVDNTSDANKPVSSATQTALNGKQASGTYATGTGTANGTNTGDQTTVSGNAGTATIFQTARNINGVSFNGSADITVAASGATLTGTTLAAGLIGTSGTTAAAGNDARLSDARTPVAHKASHQSGGSDAIPLDTLAAATDITTLNASASAHGLLPKLSGVSTEFLNGIGAFAVPAGGGGSPTFTVFTKDLGVAKASGTFDITGLSGLTAEKVVDVIQTAGKITTKGDARDESEMDSIRLAGYVVNATTIRAWWKATGIVVGTYEFAYMVSG